ncbi:phosphatase PAP2 family protein [Micromonospora craniellae]|uniref:Phosphatase PAP2 family protein n=1 Tax=Micromonospora craniellae TaxID=2294034 RepID=A0A372FRS4_9ACTN|nr:phosphatase PAP2 family protein [Micromonospora craniellae]QOC91335.1 phosphatase PAP2 family protein [Micromonospora craniellae]RFS43487.1 phosphatase PAP2 family protein [Micromonospora craniellae]
MRVTPRGGTAVWLVVLVLVQVAAFVVLWRLALYTGLGQWIDTVALTGNRIGRDHIEEPVDRILNAMSVVSLLAVTVTIGFIALMRGRIALAVAATALIAGANVSTQLLKYGLSRPDYGIDPERAFVGNSLPSGHTTVAASVAVALVLVLPPRVRALGAVIGAAYAAAAGVATLSAGWHRPSDAVAAFLVVGVWAALAGLLLLITQREQAEVAPGDAHRLTVTLLGVGGLLAIAGCVLALWWLIGVRATPPQDLGRRPLFLGYAGSAAGIAGTMGVVMALVLASVHRIVPRHQG